MRGIHAAACENSAKPPSRQDYRAEGCTCKVWQLHQLRSRPSRATSIHHGVCSVHVVHSEIPASARAVCLSLATIIPPLSSYQWPKLSTFPRPFPATCLLYILRFFLAIQAPSPRKALQIHCTFSFLPSCRCQRTAPDLRP